MQVKNILKAIALFKKKTDYEQKSKIFLQNSICSWKFQEEDKEL